MDELLELEVVLSQVELLELLEVELLELVLLELVELELKLLLTQVELLELKLLILDEELVLELNEELEDLLDDELLDETGTGGYGGFNSLFGNTITGLSGSRRIAPERLLYTFSKFISPLSPPDRYGW
jgi:hypothetical protein